MWLSKLRWILFTEDDGLNWFFCQDVSGAKLSLGLGEYRRCLGEFLYVVCVEILRFVSGGGRVCQIEMDLFVDDGRNGVN